MTAPVAKKTYNAGGAATPTPTPTATATPKTPAKTTVAKGYNAGGATTTAKTTVPKPVANPIDKAANDAWNNVLNFGQSVINAITSSGAFIIGGFNEAAKQSNANLPKGYDNWTAAQKREYLFATIRGETQTPAQKDVVARLTKIGAAAVKNGTAWTRNEPIITGKTLNKNLGIDTSGTNVFGINMGDLATDIITDPTTYVGLGPITHVLGALKTGAGTALKAGKIAAVSGEISKSRVIKQVLKEQKATLPKAEYQNLVKEQQAVTPSKRLKPGSDTFNQYTTKPLLKAENRVGDVFGHLKNVVDEKLTYETSINKNKTLRDVLGSAIEAGSKAAAARFITRLAEHSIKMELKSDVKSARIAASIADRLGEAPAPKTPQALVDGVVRDIQPFEMHVNGKNVYVMDNEQIIHKFQSQKSAKKFIESQADAPAVIKPAVKSGRIIVDTAPVVPKAAMKNAPQTLKDAEKAVKTVNGLIAKARGISKGKNTASKVRNILREATDVKAAAKSLNSDLQIGLKGVLTGKYNPLRKIQEWFTQGGEYTALARELGTKPIIGANGKEGTIADLIKSMGDVDKWSKLPESIRKQVMEHFKAFVETGKTDAAGFIAKLVAVVGKKMAERIVATGVFTGKFDGKALEAILSELPTGTVEKTYANATELADGLKAGDIVDISIINGILKAIDPNNAIVQSLQKALDTPDAYAQLRGIFILDGPQTVKQTEKRLQAMDTVTVYEAQGLAMAETTAAYTDALLNGKAPTGGPATAAAREAASQRLTQAMGSMLPEPRDRAEIAIRAIARGFEKTFEEFSTKIMASENMFKGLSTFGDLAARNTEKAFQADTIAMLMKQVNQSGEARMVGQLLGLIRKRTQDVKEIFNEFIKASALMNDTLLSVLGARITYSKAIQGAKGGKHYIYFSIGDYARIMQETGAEDLAIQSLIPEMRALGATKNDTLSTIGIGQAVRIALEQFEKTGSIIKSDVVNALKSRAATQGKRSAQFNKYADKLANDIADHITKPKVLAKFQEVHNMRAAATMEDFLNPVESLTDEVYSTFYKGWEINKIKGVDNPAARAELARTAFNKFAYFSGILRQQSGEQAQAILQAASRIFMVGGKLEKLANETEQAWLIGSPSRVAGEAANTLYADTIEALNGLFKTKTGDFVAGAGRERLPFPTELSVGKATAKLLQAKLLYEKAIAEGADLTTKAEVAAWNRKFATAQKRLDAARQTAWENSIPTEHWFDGAWIPSHTYNHAEALQLAKAGETVLTAEGTATKALISDTPLVIPGHKKLSAAESEKWLADWRVKNNIASIERVASASEAAAEELLKAIPAMEKAGLVGADLGQHLDDLQHAETLQDALIMVPVMRGPTTYASKAGTFIDAVEVKQSRLTKFANKFASNSGRYDVQPIINHMETSLMQQMSTVADYMRALRKKYIDNITADEFKQVFKAALNPEASLATLTPLGEELAVNLRNVIQVVFGTTETGAVVSRGIDPKVLSRAFKRFKINEKRGFIEVSMDNPKSLPEYLQTLPFAEMPDFIVKGSDEAIDWEKNVKKFNESNIDPFVALERIMSAVQFAAHEQHIVADFARTFSWENMGVKNAEDAIRQGFVQVKGEGSTGVNLSDLLPKPENGGLYPPYVAEQFLSMNRELNRMYNEGSVHKFIQNALELQGFLKATQTIFRLGHHVTNMFGDMSTAWISGTRDPRHYMMALSMAKRFMVEDFRSKWTAAGLDQKFENVVTAAGSYGKIPFREAGLSKNATLAKQGYSEMNIKLTTRDASGKLKYTKIALDGADPMFKERNLIMSDIFTNDIQGLSDSVLADATKLGAEGTLKGEKIAKLRQGVHAVERIPGSFASWYSNIPRIATAIRVIESRSWRSLDEALNAAQREVNKFHPTIQSLSASERKFIRPIFSYYTWQRGAHFAFLDMALNHTSAMTLYSKAQYNAEQGAGLQPQSFGNPFPTNTTVPQYLDYTPYGPGIGIGGEPMIFKRSLLALDILDKWKFGYDSAYDPSQNFFRNYDQLSKTVAGDISIIGKPITGFLGGDVDPGTGRPNKVTDLASFGDTLLSNVGAMSALKGLGVPTFSQMAGNEAPFSEGEKQLMLQNWLTGQRGVRIFSEANMKNARLENAARTKNINARIQKGEIK